MKKCPFCKEEIQDTAAKCRYCGEWIEKKEEPTPTGPSSPQQSTVTKIPIKSYAATAAWWALGLSLGFILGPIVISLVSGAEISGN